ncbi:DNA invertase Pin-like site-specific DNA recombinase [Frondihabitans sp. PhB188]|uniref:recombinase family protein n=1 Tax=Frondihabitans sp. PhB188 TaxID=2485200 RepID=UPI000FBA9AA4|nr:recombinase family protein [Frondihabitans sp. PhB188]ROQ40964.1 DNA invertase Pin-like site-specific DNA recombinase [Frondihabitans sp. PhB188]
MTSPHVSPTGTVVGYARVSTDKQDEARQLSALRDAGITNHALYVDSGQSGAKTSRPEFDRMLANVTPGDLVVVAELDRLGRNSGHVIVTIADLRERGIHVKSIADGVDSTTDMGEAMMGFLAIMAQMERRFILRRTRSGLAEARAQGRFGGRPRALDSKKAALAIRLSDEGEKVADIATTLGTSVPTIYRYLNAYRVADDA